MKADAMQRFIYDEDGAATVDWVVLTAAIALLGLTVQINMGTATKHVADKISTSIASTDVLWTY